MSEGEKALMQALVAGGLPVMMAAAITAAIRMIIAEILAGS
jgi:hypothetical protein